LTIEFPWGQHDGRPHGIGRSTGCGGIDLPDFVDQLAVAIEQNVVHLDGVLAGKVASTVTVPLLGLAASAAVAMVAFGAPWAAKNFDQTSLIFSSWL
jgi:hypothetical protein